MLDNAVMRARVAGVVEPVARGLLKVGLSPDTVTWLGATAVIVSSLAFIIPGHFLIGGIFFGVLALSDLLDGTMARISGTSGPWGAFLDSTLDRVVDAAVLGSVIVYYINHPAQSWIVPVGLLALVSAQLTSYIRARAESLGTTCKVGIGERFERSLILWVALMVQGFGLLVLPTAVALLALMSTITVVQRLVHVRNQLAT